MRFLNTTTLRFEQVADSELQLKENQYAILSHRWGRDEDEITYQEINSSADVSRKKGFPKIEGFCRIASLENCRYGWVDTCCINKGDSSELTEAINSMYRWYKCAKVCVVYLEDVRHQQPITESEWFDRGWTLQELIAPKDVCFFDQTWNLVGTKIELLPDLSRKTRVPNDVLSHATKPSSCSVAQRMSWAASRITKRIEDRAYSLMGLFDVYMPMIYGEREKAFLRLQQHIIVKYKDESLFAWAMEDSDDTTTTYSGLYAPSPSVYRNCNTIVPTPSASGVFEIGGELSLKTEILPYTPGTYRAMLHCTDIASKADNRVGIMVASTSEANNDIFVRVVRPKSSSQKLFSISRKRVERDIRVPVDASELGEPPIPVYYGFWLRTLQPPGHAESQMTILSNCPASEPDYICQDYSNQGNTGVVRITPNDNSERSNWSRVRWIKFGFSKTLQPVLWLANDTQSSRLDDPFELALESQKSIARSREHWDVMKEDLLEACDLGEVEKPTQQLRYDWPEGRFVMQVHGTELRDFVIDKLNLKISVQLQPFNTPSIPISRSIESVRLPVIPMMVWVVDITTKEGQLSSLSEGQLSSTTGPENRCEAFADAFCELSCLYLPCCPCALIICCCGSDELRDVLFFPSARARRRMERSEREENKKKQEYLLNADSRLLLLETRIGKE